MIETYIRQKFVNVIDYYDNDNLLYRYPYHMFIKHIDIDNKKILHVFNGLDNKNKITYQALIINTPIDQSCIRNYFYQRLQKNYYIEYLQSDCSGLSVFSFIKDDDDKLKKFYLKRYNFSVLPSTKYMLKKLERDPDFLAPLIITTLTSFYEFYKQFYLTVSTLEAQLNIKGLA